MSCYTSAAARDAARRECKQMNGALFAGRRRQAGDLLRACKLVYTLESVGLSSVWVSQRSGAISRRYAAAWQYDKAYYHPPQCQQLAEQLLGEWWTHCEAVRPAAKIRPIRAHQHVFVRSAANIYRYSCVRERNYERSYMSCEPVQAIIRAA